MTQEQLYAEIIALIAKNQIEQDHRIGKDFKEAQKSLLDAAKELFVNHDKEKTLVHLTATISHLSSKQKAEMP